MKLALEKENKVYTCMMAECDRYTFSLEKSEYDWTLNFLGEARPTISECSQIISEIFKQSDGGVISITIEVKNDLTTDNAVFKITDSDSEILKKLVDTVRMPSREKIIG